MSNRSTWDGIPEGLHGDKTTTGAQGLSSLPSFSNAHLGALRHGDKTTPCPKCGKVGEIIGNIPTMNLEGKIAAGSGAIVICGCPMGSNTLISPAGQWMGNTPRPEPTWVKQTAEPEQHAQTARKKRTGVDAGFCVVPQQATTESFESILFAGAQPDGTRELYRSLNGAGKEYKAGSILLVVDPDKQDSDQIAHMQKAKERVDTALAPLTHQEANFLHKHKDTIDLFTSRASTTTGVASEAAGKYFEKVEGVLAQIQQTYKNQYITSGSLIGEQFYVQRRQLFNELDGILNDFTRHKLALQDYPDIKSALGLSSSSITHRWNQTGVADIEGYATFIEKASKYVKMMKTAGYVGIALDGVNRLDKIYEACTVGSDCEETAYTEVGSFGMSIGGGVFAGSLVSGGASATVCSFVLGALTIEAAGAGMLACGVIFTGAAGYAGGKMGGKLGEILGEKVYEVTK
jgi:uncharacterized Zn-binding protein involved in type VI secretion